MAPTHVKFPPCGMFIGSCLYLKRADYLICSGRAYTCWVPPVPWPEEMLDRVAKDNQGNFVLLFGATGREPETAAWLCALDEIGVSAPKPDWENRRFLTRADWPEIEKHADRYGAGLLRFLKRAADKGIYAAIVYADARPEWSRRFREAGDYYVGYNYGERHSFRLDDALLAGKELATVNLHDLAEGLLRRVREHVDERHANGWGPIIATSGGFHLDYEIAAGTDIPVVEDFAFSHLNLSSALARGLCRQYARPYWGAHLAHEHYSWIPYRSEFKFDLLRSAMLLKYMSGARMILLESGNWFVEGSLCEDSPMHDMPIVEQGPITNRDPRLFAPLVPLARKKYSAIDYSSPISRRYRQVVSDFYDFVKANGTPEGQPETTVAVVKGNLDLCAHEFNPNYAVGGAFALADLNNAWFEGAPERGWEIVRNVFFPRPPVLSPHLNSFLSGTPWGMVDIVSFAQDNVDADFLSAHYKALIFAGWNTASEKQYAALLDYVTRGGRLFISIPHLSTNDRRNYTSYGVDELVRGGDFAELCGVRVRGRGRRIYWATAPDKKGTLGFALPRRFGIFTTCMGDVEIRDPNMEALAVEDEEMMPLLFRRRCGKGEVFFLNSWAYPGALTADYGPGAYEGSKGLIGAVYQHIASLSRGKVWITDDGARPGPQCDHVACSWFPEAGKVFLLNIDFRNARRVRLHRSGSVEVVELGPAEFKTISVTASETR